MSFMKIISDIISAIRANMKCLCLKVFHPKAMCYHPYLRMNGNVEIRLQEGVINLGKGILIASNSVISATDGGKLSIGKMVGINRNSMIMCHDRVCIGDNTIKGPGVYIYDHDHVFDSNDGVRRNEYVTAPITIGKNCWIGANTVILRGTTIGDNCLIAAGCVLKGNYPDGSVVIQKREEIIKQK